MTDWSYTGTKLNHFSCDKSCNSVYNGKNHLDRLKIFQDWIRTHEILPGSNTIEDKRLYYIHTYESSNQRNYAKVGDRVAFAESINSNSFIYFRSKKEYNDFMNGVIVAKNLSQEQIDLFDKNARLAMQHPILSQHCQGYYGYVIIDKFLVISTSGCERYFNKSWAASPNLLTIEMMKTLLDNHAMFDDNIMYSLINNKISPFGITKIKTEIDNNISTRSTLLSLQEQVYNLLEEVKDLKLRIRKLEEKDINEDSNYKQIINRDNIDEFVANIDNIMSNKNEVFELIAMNDSVKIFKYLYKNGYADDIETYIHENLEKMTSLRETACYGWYQYKTLKK